MADRMRVTSLIRSRIPPQQEAGKNGPRKTVLALVGLLDLRAQAEVPSALRADTPPSADARFVVISTSWLGMVADAARRARGSPGFFRLEGRQRRLQALEVFALPAACKVVRALTRGHVG